MDRQDIAGAPGKGANAQPLTEADLTNVSGGVGYASVKCKQCGKTFSDLDAYQRHIMTAHQDKR